MLTKWQIFNIKSYSGTHDVPLSMINIIAGANSSGKSTLIQSILLLKQTLQYASGEKSLLMNGPLVRLGSIDDITNELGQEEGIGISFSISFSQEETATASRQWRQKSIFLPWSNTDSYLSRISLDLKWGKSSGFDTEAQRKFVPQLLKSSLDVSRNRKDDLTNSKLDVIFDTENYYGSYSVAMDAGLQVELGQNRPESQILGAVTDKFLPQYVIVKYNAAAKRAAEISAALFDRSWVLLASDPPHSGFTLPERVVNFVHDWLLSRGAPVTPSGPLTVAQLKRQIQTVLPPKNMFNLKDGKTDADDREAASIAASVRALLLEEEGKDDDYDFPLPSDVRQANDILEDFFKQGVRYLGPLRDPPRPVYQLEALPSTTDIGYRGEHTAAVMDLNADKKVEYFPPPDDRLTNDYISNVRKKAGSLQEAVVEWLSYLGVAEDVMTSDEGVFGNRLQVSTADGLSMHDLTNVGVGVSQVLPIVVMALLAPPVSLLIFEQPELHLHPKVQARLADFFLSLALSGKQTIAETHSEYLIDRIRLRIALSNNDKVNEMVNILFSERGDKGTKLSSIVVNEYGAILNWPRDFFDQSQGDVSKILKAASSKRIAAKRR